MNQQHKNILISGSSGFVGQNLIPYLQKHNYDVTGVTRSPKNTKEVSYTGLSQDIWNKSFAFIHLAGKAHDLKGVSNDAEYYEVNTELTKTLFNQFLNSDCTVFIYISSVKAAADEVADVLSEDMQPKPVTVYGKSKLAAEAYLMEQTLPEDKSLFILRPCMIHGPGNKGNLNLLFSMAAKGIPYPFGAYKNERSFLSIDNLSYVLKELLEQRPASGIYNVADDTYLSTSNVYEIMGEVLGKNLKILNVSKTLINLVGKVGDVIPIPINSEKIQKLTENYRVSNVKILKALEISTMPLTAKEGLIKTIESFKKSK